MAAVTVGRTKGLEGIVCGQIRVVWKNISFRRLVSLKFELVVGCSHFMSLSNKSAGAGDSLAA